MTGTFEGWLRPTRTNRFLLVFMTQNANQHSDVLFCSSSFKGYSLT
jgi:hypothetical protein